VLQINDLCKLVLPRNSCTDPFFALALKKQYIIVLSPKLGVSYLAQHLSDLRVKVVYIFSCSKTIETEYFAVLCYIILISMMKDVIYWL
jgi:hypothetical protein